MKKLKGALIAMFFLCLSAAFACGTTGGTQSSQESSKESSGENVLSSESLVESSIESSVESSVENSSESSVENSSESSVENSSEGSVENSSESSVENSSESSVESSEDISSESSVEESSSEVESSIESSVEESSEEVFSESSIGESSEETSSESSADESSVESSSDVEECVHAYDELTKIDDVWVYECVNCDFAIPLLSTWENGEFAEGLVDFAVEVEEGKDPVVLQISDPQFSDWGTPDSYCYNYLQETIDETQPDLILVTGDIVYGKFDEDGQFLLDYIEFMESFQIPWAPIFGNHENECILGVDWQCEQLENAEYCLFEQRSLTGNGNYSVGLLQGNKLLRVFYMLDSNGCDAPSPASVSSVNGIKTTAGFAQDQIDWYTASITALKTFAPKVKISFTYHIQQAVFEDAIEKYSDAFEASSSAPNILLNIDGLETESMTDFGCIGKQTEKLWDTDYSVWNGMKALGVDSVFIGHQHTNSFSIVYEGVRLQFGQKSSMYDSFNWVLPDGTIQSGSMETKPDEGNSLVGGTVIPVSAEDGSIGKGYIYYAGDPFTFTGSAGVLQGDARTRMPVYSDDVTALGFAADTTVYALENTIAGGWGDTWTTRAIVCAPGTQDYVTVEFVSEEDITGSPFYLWGVKGSPAIGYVKFAASDIGSITDMDGYAITSITAGEHYLLNMACADLSEIQFGLCYGINTVYFANIAFNNGEIPVPTTPVDPDPTPITPSAPAQGDSSAPMPTYNGDVTALGFAEGTTVYALENTQEGTWTDDTWDARSIIYTPGTQDYVTIEFVVNKDIVSSNFHGPFYLWGVAGSPAIGYVKLATTDIGLITDMDGNAVTSITAGQHYLLHIACVGLSEIQIGSVYGASTVYFANVTYSNGTFTAN